MSRPCPAPSRRHRPLRAMLVATACTLTVVAAACTADESADPPDTTVDDETAIVDDPLSYVAYVDPAAPIVAEVGERFALILDAEPTEGYRWEVVSEVDRATVLPLGSQFVLRDTVTDLPTTTLAPPPPPPPPADGEDSGPADDSTEGTEGLVGGPDGEGPEVEATAPLTIEPAPTTATLLTRSLQVLSYVARAPGTTTVELRYVRVGRPDAKATTVVFTIEVPQPPPLFPVPEEEVEGEEEPAAEDD